jgi:hypothetical protein
VTWPQETPELLDIGTLVTALVNGRTVTGRVEDYEHYSRTQSTFPVSFGPVWRAMRRRDVTVLDRQPADRRPPRRTGKWMLPPDASGRPQRTTTAAPSRSHALNLLNGAA